MADRIILPDRVVPMRVIVCGVQRTGTLSTSKLTKLPGYILFPWR